MNTDTPAIIRLPDGAVPVVYTDGRVVIAKRAIDEKIEQRAEFCEWWKKAVRGVGNPTKKRPKLIGADRGRLAQMDVEQLTGITQQQVSKWRKRTH